MSRNQKYNFFSNEEIYYAISKSSIGFLLVAKTVKGLCAVFLADTALQLEKEIRSYFPTSILIVDESKLEKYVDAVKKIIENPKDHLYEEQQLPLDLRGTAFQLKVWKELMLIPKGSTLSYSELALKMGCLKSFRAVANACGANRVAIVIPCHRVIKKDGSLSGYRWGSAFKKELLLREKF